MATVDGTTENSRRHTFIAEIRKCISTGCRELLRSSSSNGTSIRFSGENTKIGQGTACISSCGSKCDSSSKGGEGYFGIKAGHSTVGSQTGNGGSFGGGSGSGSGSGIRGKIHGRYGTRGGKYRGRGGHSGQHGCFGRKITGNVGAEVAVAVGNVISRGNEGLVR